MNPCISYKTVMDVHLGILSDTSNHDDQRTALGQQFGGADSRSFVAVCQRETPGPGHPPRFRTSVFPLAKSMSDQFEFLSHAELLRPVVEIGLVDAVALDE